MGSLSNDTNLFLMIFPRVSLCSKLVPVQYREYDIDLFLIFPDEPPLQASSSPIREYDINLFLIFPDEPPLQASSSPIPRV